MATMRQMARSRAMRTIKRVAYNKYSNASAAIGKTARKYAKKLRSPKGTIALGSLGLAADIIHFGIKNHKEIAAIMKNRGNLPGVIDAKVKALSESSKLFLNPDQGMSQARSVYQGFVRDPSDHKVHKLSDSMSSGKKSALLVQAAKDYGTMQLNWFSTEKTAYNRLYAYSGLNTKGIWCPYTTVNNTVPYISIDNITLPNNYFDGYYFMGESMNDQALWLYNTLIKTTSAGALSSSQMPPITTGDVDYFYPFQGYKSVYRFTNGNQFLPLTLQLFVLCAKRNTTRTPLNAWFSPSGTQSSDQMNTNYITYRIAEAIAGCASTPTNPYTTLNVHPEARPGLSALFRDTYEIIKVHELRLNAGDALEYTLNVDFKDAFSAALYNNEQIVGTQIAEGSYHILPVFQGVPCPYLVTSNTSTPAAPIISYSASANNGFAKLYCTVDKYLYHSLPIQNALGLYDPTAASYSPTFLKSKITPLVNYSDTAPYSQYANTFDANKYLVPLTSDTSLQFGAPLAADPA